MSEIALYNTLTNLGLDHEAAKEAVADVASSKEVATKSDIAEVKTDIAELETRLVKQVYAVAGIIIVVILAGIGLMFRFFMM